MQLPLTAQQPPKSAQPYEAQAAFTANCDALKVRLLPPLRGSL